MQVVLNIPDGEFCDTCEYKQENLCGIFGEKLRGNRPVRVTKCVALNEVEQLHVREQISCLLGPLAAEDYLYNELGGDLGSLTRGEVNHLYRLIIISGMESPSTENKIKSLKSAVDYYAKNHAADIQRVTSDNAEETSRTVEDIILPCIFNFMRLNNMCKDYLSSGIIKFYGKDGAFKIDLVEVKKRVPVFDLSGRIGGDSPDSLSKEQVIEWLTKYFTALVLELKLTGIRRIDMLTHPTNASWLNPILTSLSFVEIEEGSGHFTWEDSLSISTDPDAKE